MLFELLLPALGSCAVGLFIGWCGVAGFLLPILFVNACGLSVTESLLLSFLCFAISGAIGSWNYHRRGELPLRPALILSAGSLAGGLLGAALGGLLEPETVKVVLYIVVLLSGLAIVLRELRPQKSGGGSFPGTPPLLALGFATALLCALSGAGGPVLVMPLLVAMGVPAKTAVGVALLDSVFIALPAIAVYGSRCGALAALLPVLLAAALGHAAGVSVGSVTAAHVPQSLLKRGVAVFSICFSLLMLLK
ncbi:MAG: sulfite exporter TauE/SafE family protein [Oscillibacter sp.]|nr:sulfite exporter TauE/SafE family protein [Oscillibacter sp.]